MTVRAQRIDDLGPLFAWVPSKPTTSPAILHEGKIDHNDYAGSSGSGTLRNPGSRDPRVPEPDQKNINDFTGSWVPPLQGEETPGSHAPPTPNSSLSSAGFGGALEGCASGPESPLEIQTPEPDRDLAAPVAPTPRPYQLAAKLAIQADWARGVQRTLLVLPTGTGKTVVFADLVRDELERVDGRVLVLAHRSELLEQARNKLRDVGVWAALEKAEHRARTERVVVASVQSLKGKRLRRFRPDEFDVVIVDEAHHTTASSYRGILDYFSGARVLGVTATPDRADGTALGKIFGSCAYRYELRDAIRDRWLVPIIARRIFLAGVDLSRVKSLAGDLAQDELAEIMAADEAVIGVVVPLLEQSGDRRTIVFGVDVAHSMAIATAICDRRPGAARVAHGELDDSARAELLADFRAGRFQYLVNCALYTEGFDEPSVACVACARPTKSRSLYTQMVGRGTRLLGATWDESVRSGKLDLLLLDFAGNAGRHKLVGPLDALAPGEVSDAVREQAERMLEDDAQDLDALVDEAAAELERRRQELRRGAHAAYFTRDVDPFFGEQLGEPYTGDWALEIATADERTELLALGLKRIPAELTRGEARQIVEADRKRRKLGLATYKQCSLLSKFGLDVKTMTKAGASARIGVLAACDWDFTRAGPRLREIQAGELLRRDRGGA